MQNLQQSAQNPEYYPTKPAQPLKIGTRRSCSRPKTGRGAAGTPQKSGRGSWYQEPGAAAAGSTGSDPEPGAAGRAFLFTGGQRPHPAQLVPGAIRAGAAAGDPETGNPAQLVPAAADTRNQGGTRRDPGGS